MIQSKNWETNRKLYVENIKELLIAKIDSTDFESAKADVRPFITDQDALSLWSKEFFKNLTDRLTS